MDAELIRKFITQQVTVAIAEKTKQYEKKIKHLRKLEETECWESHPQKTVRGAVYAPRKKENIPDSNKHQVKTTSEFCVSIGTRLKEHPLEPLKGTILKSRRCQQRYVRKREKEKKQRAQKAHRR